MNIYARYFDQDTLVYSIDELIEFLSTISDISITKELIEDIQTYIESDMPYPKRYKIRPRVYFILIKTTAQSLEEFKANKKETVIPLSSENEIINKKELRTNQLIEENSGWYKGSITFKRVIQIPGTGKFQYQDTPFVALVKAQSGIECYNRIIDHLKGRQDIDPRSQFPSAKGVNFEFKYMGEKLTEEEENPEKKEEVDTSTKEN